MNELKLPTIGRQVNYFPNGNDAHVAHNGATILPATVIQVFGSRLNLAVTCMNSDGPVVLRYSVAHLSDTSKNQEGDIIGAYWDWPEIK